jgi:hypothetical protein
MPYHIKAMKDVACRQVDTFIFKAAHHSRPSPIDGIYVDMPVCGMKVQKTSYMLHNTNAANR